MSSTRIHRTFFWVDFTIEYTHSNSFDFWFEYTNKSYNDDRQLYLAFLRRVWISWGGYNGRVESVRYGIKINTNCIAIYYWVCDFFEEMPGKKLWTFHWDRINDFLFGRQKYHHTYEKEYWKFRMKLNHWDEYNVSITSCERIVSRGRFITHRWMSYECTPDRWIPHQGKWENSWDCGDDATYSMSCSAKSPEEALEKLRVSSEKTRGKYGMVSSMQYRTPEHKSLIEKLLWKNQQ